MSYSLLTRSSMFGLGSGMDVGFVRKGLGFGVEVGFDVGEGRAFGGENKGWMSYVIVWASYF